MYVVIRIDLYPNIIYHYQIIITIYLPEAKSTAPFTFPIIRYEEEQDVDICDTIRYANIRHNLNHNESLLLYTYIV